MPTIKMTVDSRTFLVDFNAERQPVRIKERKLHAKGTIYECWYNAAYWSAKHHKIGSENTVVARILKKALNA